MSGRLRIALYLLIVVGLANLPALDQQQRQTAKRPLHCGLHTLWLYRTNSRYMFCFVLVNSKCMYSFCWDMSDCRVNATLREQTCCMQTRQTWPSLHTACRACSGAELHVLSPACQALAAGLWYHDTRVGFQPEVGEIHGLRT